MRSGRNFCLACLLVVIAAGAFVWAADENATKSDSSKANAAKSDAKASDAARTAGATATPDMPDPAKMMEIMMKLGTPGPEHEKLKQFVGKWDADVTVQMMPSVPEEKSKGTETNEMILGGRYLKSEFNGEFAKQPFNGQAIWGYDNAKKKYFNSWIDSMSTMMMTSEGTADDAGKVITFKCDSTCPITNKPMAMRQVLTIEDNDHHTYESYVSLDGSPEHKTMTIKYTRAK